MVATLCHSTYNVICLQVTVPTTSLSCHFCLLNGCVPQPVYVLLNRDKKLVTFVTVDDIKTLYDVMKHSHHQPPILVSPFLSIHCWSRLLLAWCWMSFHRCLYGTDLEGGADWDWGQLYYSISYIVDVIWVSWSYYEVRLRTEPLFWNVSLPYRWGALPGSVAATEHYSEDYIQKTALHACLVTRYARKGLLRMRPHWNYNRKPHLPVLTVLSKHLYYPKHSIQPAAFTYLKMNYGKKPTM